MGLILAERICPISVCISPRAFSKHEHMREEGHSPTQEGIARTTHVTGWVGLFKQRSRVCHRVAECEFETEKEHEDEQSARHAPVIPDLRSSRQIPIGMQTYHSISQPGTPGTSKVRAITISRPTLPQQHPPSTTLPHIRAHGLATLKVRHGSHTRGGH